MELGIYSFADTAVNPETGRRLNQDQRIRDLVEEIELADAVGLDVFGVGEHHRPDFAVSAPAIVLAAAAVRTKRIRLTSAVTVLGSEDPVRVFQHFATIDALSNGRAEIMAGRGSFLESFPLFGYDLDDYDSLFAEKLELLLRVREQEVVTWQGRHRAAIPGRGVYPRPVQQPLPVWLAIGGNHSSATRAARLGLPLALAIIGGMPERFAPVTEYYRREFARSGQAGASRVGINSLGYVAETAEQAAAEWFPSYQALFNQLGRERGWAPTTRADFDAQRSPRGALLVGSPEDLTEKILFEHSLFGNERFLVQMDIGWMPHGQVMRAIELLGTKVAPAVRARLAEREKAAPRD